MSEDTHADGPVIDSELWQLLHREEYTPREAAEVLNISEGLLLQAAFGGELKARIINGDVVSIRRADLATWWQQRGRA